MNRKRTFAKVASALALGAALGFGGSTAHAQVAVRGPVAVAPVRGYYGYPRVYGPAYYNYTPSNPNGYVQPGRSGPGPIRDWASGRTVRVAKPWLAPLPR